MYILPINLLTQQKNWQEQLHKNCSMFLSKCFPSLGTWDIKVVIFNTFWDADLMLGSKSTFFWDKRSFATVYRLLCLPTDKNLWSPLKYESCAYLVPRFFTDLSCNSNSLSVNCFLAAFWNLSVADFCSIVWRTFIRASGFILQVSVINSNYKQMK